MFWAQRRKTRSSTRPPCVTCSVKSAPPAKTTWQWRPYTANLNRTPTDARPEPRTVQNAESRSVFHGGSDSDTLVSSASRWYCRNRAGLVKTLIYWPAGVWIYAIINKEFVDATYRIFRPAVTGVKTHVERQQVFRVWVGSTRVQKTTKQSGGPFKEVFFLNIIWQRFSKCRVWLRLWPAARGRHSQFVSLNATISLKKKKLPQTAGFFFLLPGHKLAGDP